MKAAASQLHGAIFSEHQPEPNLIMQLYIDNASHLVPYAVLLLVYLVLAYHDDLLKVRSLTTGMILLLLIGFAGFREIMTPDMERYRAMYEYIGSENSLAIEPSFVYLSQLFNRLNFGYHAIFFIYSFITITFVYSGIVNYTIKHKLSLLLYVLIPSCFLNLFVEMREVSAVAIAFYATSLIINRETKFKVVKVLFFAILSITFHYSAIIYWVVFAVFYKFIKIRHSTWYHLFLVSISLLIPTSVVIAGIHALAYPFLPGKYQGYFNMFLEMENQLTESGQLLKSLIYTLMAGLFSFWGSRFEKEDDAHIFVNLFVVGVIVLNLTRSFADISRIAYFFLIFQIVIFPLIVQRQRHTMRALWCACLIVGFYFTQFIWGLFYYSEEAGSYVFLHYQNALFSMMR